MTHARPPVPSGDDLFGDPLTAGAPDRLDSSAGPPGSFGDPARSAGSALGPAGAAEPAGAAGPSVGRAGSGSSAGSAGSAGDVPDPAEGMAIYCRDLVRIYTAEGIEVQALQGVDLHVADGELVAIIGVSGSGKSTLMSILAGLDRATAGTAVVAGHDLLRMSRAERVNYQRFGVGFVWQQASRNLLGYLTAAENVAMVMALSHRSERRAQVASLLDLLGVGYCADRRPAELSGGEQQRVAIAVALANGPAVLLADEPTGELDEHSTAEVLEALRRVNTELRTTTLIVTHDPTVAAHVRRTIHIRDGRISTETMRRTVVDEHGRERRIAEDFAVVDRLGRMQLPQQAVMDLGLRQRVRLAERDDHLAVYPQQADAPAESDVQRWEEEQ